jgi:CheY-like chemotaxis protein
MTSHPATPSILWCLRGHGKDVRCQMEHARGDLELRILWGDELFLSERFHDHERLRTRADELRTTLEARGWRRLATGDETLIEEIAAGVLRSQTAAAVAPRRPRQPATMPARPRRPSDKPPTVLIVDDEPAIRSSLRRYLEKAGYLVREAADVDGALASLDDAPVDAVILDVRMPDPKGLGRTGLEVLAFIRLHQNYTDLPVLVLTGYVMNSEERLVVERHRAHLFIKPEGYRTLLEQLDTLTGRAR